MPKKTRKKADTKRGVQLEINVLNKFEIETLYVNNVSASMSPFELTLRFGQIQQKIKGKVLVSEVAAIVMAPYFAKALLTLLSTTVANYEENQGEIPDPYGSKVLTS